ncbi:MAG: class I SAM-dependent rRNA methyltransferase [Gammaproteobacteria bacterium]|nr:class I SAM-dependent rRNA methyltransferase [Gammaproteobacteria bacterium]MCI0590849.1 class I SAM-dependent rRNA methyltransferase [Gammaproteobacteria bacterium]
MNPLTPAMKLPPLCLKKGEDRRLRAGHQWVFSNEVDTEKTSLTQFTPGEPIIITTNNGKELGTGYVNPHSLICARLVSRDPSQVLGTPLIEKRLATALALRERLFDSPFYRLAYGESDGLPGLVVDRYGEVLVAQIATAGMEMLKNEIVSCLIEVVKPAAILLRNDMTSRTMEGLNCYVQTAFGTVPSEVSLIENGARFDVPMLDGQKTGWYYDHTLNRARMQRYVKGGRVLDVFSYLGAWGLQAAVAGAREITCVDASEKAIDYVRRNAALNQLDNVEVQTGDAFSTLKNFRNTNKQFDIIILDPPALIKRKKDAKAGLTAYLRLNQAAMQLLGEDGILISSSCSTHLQREVFLDMIRRTARRLKRRVQIIEQGHQAPDHPIHPAIPETEYLKLAICRVCET